jgi:Fur family ferric uptake transcriptional regulator
MAPEEVHTEVQRMVDGTGIATIYRNIKSLVEQGWLTTVELPGQPPRYELAGKEHHHHFYCTRCGLVFELTGCGASFPSPIPAGFEVTGHDVFLYGLCRACGEQTQKKRQTYRPLRTGVKTKRG